jgi:hypothetical protein
LEPLEPSLGCAARRVLERCLGPRNDGSLRKQRDQRRQRPVHFVAPLYRLGLRSVPSLPEPRVGADRPCRCCRRAGHGLSVVHIPALVAVAVRDLFLGKAVWPTEVCRRDCGDVVTFHRELYRSRLRAGRVPMDRRCRGLDPARGLVGFALRMGQQLASDARRTLPLARRRTDWVDRRTSFHERRPRFPWRHRHRVGSRGTAAAPARASGCHFHRIVGGCGLGDRPPLRVHEVVSDQPGTGDNAKRSSGCSPGGFSMRATRSRRSPSQCSWALLWQS